jgi:hypothetical protein
MFDTKTVQRIEEFVAQHPRSVQEVAKHLDVSWRTADRYVDEIERNQGTIATRVFRGGTRGALKIAYWAAVERIKGSVFQERLEEEILRAHQKQDFSAFDIFQHIDAEHSSAHMDKAAWEEGVDLTSLARMLAGARKQVLIGSGNLSFINIKTTHFDMLRILGGLVERGVPVRILCRVDLVGKDNIEKVLALNMQKGKQMIEIRHREQPLRAFIVDYAQMRLIEIKEPTGRKGELDKKVYINYTITDKGWVEWLSKLFWKMFSNSIDARKRLEKMRALR